MPSKSCVAGLAATLLLVATQEAHASHTLWTTGESRFSSMGRAISSAGDFNGDGLGDWVVGVPFRFLRPGGTATIYLGAPQGQDFSSMVLSGADPAELFGSTVANAGDLDDDGFSDLLVTSLGLGVQVFRGGATPDAVADVLLAARPGGFGAVLAPAGDWNGDGFDDFIVGAPSDSTLGPRAGRAYVFFGGATLDATPDMVLDGGAAGDEFGSALAGGVDVNGDGSVDLVVGAPLADDAGASRVDCGEVRVYLGGPGIFDSTPDRILKGGSTNGYFGTSVALLADWNGDGTGDIAVGAPGVPSGGRIYLFHGGAALDAVPDWTAGDPALALGSAIAAGDDVNRDHTSDLVAAGSPSEALLFFGGATADTLPDSPLSVPHFSYSGGSHYVAGAGDVNGDGYQDWLFGEDTFGGQGSTDFVGLCTAHGDLQLIGFSGVYDNQVLGGADALVNYAGAEVADLEFARDGVNWQTLAYGLTGVPGAGNSVTVTIPPGRVDHTARLRLMSVSPADTLIDLGDGRFSVTDSVQTQCFGTTATPAGTGVTWSAIWPGYSGATQKYRLYREDGGIETLIGADPILEEGFLDPAGSATSTYRLAAVRPDGAEIRLDSLATGTFSCDSIHLIEPNGGESLFLANFLNVVWTGTRPIDVQLSRDDGQTWETVRVGEVPPSTTLIGSAPATRQARVRVLTRGVGGAVWDDSDAPFTIHTALDLQRLVAIALPAGGVRLEWDSAPEPSLETFLGYRLCRADTLPEPGCNPIGPWPNSGTSYTDPAGTPGSVYRLWATLFDYTEVLLGDVTVASGPGTSAAFGPSPAHANEEVVLTMATPQTPNGPATDVEVRVYDTTGRMIALLGSGLGIDGTFTLRWIPAQHGMRSGIYWVRARSASTGFTSNRRIVVL